MLERIERVLREAYGLEGARVADKGVGQGQTARFEVDGPGGKSIAKLYGPSAGERLDWVRFECALLQRLKSGGFPVAGVRTTLMGEPFTMVDGRPLLVYEWAEGAIEWPAAPESARRLGCALAEMHSAMDAFACPDAPRVYDIDRLVDRPVRLLEPLASGSSEFERLVELTSRIKDKIAGVPLTVATFGPIHGDIHQGNCFFCPDGRLSVFDFALCGVGYRAYDLTGFLWPMRDATIEQPAMRSCCDAFLGGYRSVRTLLDEEEEALSAFVQVRTLWETGDWIDTGSGREQPDEVRKAIPYVVEPFSRWAAGLRFRL